MVGFVRGFISLVKKKKISGITTHCVIHGDMLVSNTLGDETK
jgi:hypothetical protein